MSGITELHQQAIHLINQKAYVKAHPLLVNIIKLRPEHADAYFLLGVINLELGQFDKSAALIEKAYGLKPGEEYRVYLAKAYAMQRDRGNVERIMSSLQPDDIKQALNADTLGVALSKVGLHEQAMAYYQQAIALDDKQESFYYNFGVAAKFLGHFDDAEAAFKKAISLNHKYVKAHFALAELSPAEDAQEHIKRLSALLEVATHPEETLHLGHALAREHEKLQQYQQTMAILDHSKQHCLSKLHYHKAAEKNLFSALSNNLSTPISSEGDTSDQPIFVVGMPRSGTTLLERILTSHTDVASGEELHDFSIAVKDAVGNVSRHLIDETVLEAAYQADFNAIGQNYIQRTALVGKNHRRFVDKLPFNFLYLDLIRRALPNAKIICMLRNPMDTCIGNYRQLFSLQNPFTAYSYDLNATGEYYTMFYRWVNDFAAQGHPNFMFVDYEALVNKPEPHIRNLLNFCGLDWQEACLHVENNQAPVSTASKVQVREPINNRSIGRWKRYQPHTQALEDYFKQQNIPF